MPARLSPAFHTAALALGISLIYWWLHVPGLQSFSLQAFACIGLLYFLVKKINKNKAWHILPTFMTIETVLATMAFLLLIGATGNTSSWFYPLTYIHLFFVIFSSQVGTSIMVTLLIMLFHYGLSPNLVQHELIALATLPIIMVFFIFAKLQHEEVIQDQLIISEEKEQLHELTTVDFRLQSFLQNFLSPKITHIEKLLEYSQNAQPISGQLQLIKIEIEKLLSQLKTDE